MADWKPLTPPILPQNFAREIADPANSILVVHWWAVWDNYDRELDRRIQLLRPQFEPRIRFRSFDVDLPDGLEITRQYGLQSIPALFCFLHGKYREKLLGLGTYERTEATLTAWVAAADTANPG